MDSSPLSSAPSTEAAPAAAAFPYEDTFKLHSVPGAQRFIYLDFRGGVIQGSAWNDAYTSGAPMTALAYDGDGNPASFSNTELDAVQDIWQRVAEDYAPFAIDVTTEDPGAGAIDRTDSGDTTFGTHAVVTNSTLIATACGCAGVSYVGVFDMTSVHQRYQPAWIFQQGKPDTKYTAEVITHEVGHTLGLSHDGNSSTPYFAGQGPWAPIMGMSYYHPITQFSRGDYGDANNHEDDFAVMQSHGAPPVADDHGIGTTGSTPLGAGPTYAASGIIGNDADVDVFSLTAPDGQLAFSASPAPRGPDLDIQLELLDASGTVLASDDPPAAQPNSSNYDGVTGLGASVSRIVTAGTYYLRVQGVGFGTATTGYSGYGSVGRYTLSGSTGPVATALPTLSVDNVTMNEGNAGTTSAAFTVSLSAPSANPVTVAVHTANGTATAGSDYTAAATTLTIPAGQTSTTYDVAANGDTTPEPNDTFSLVLSAPNGATIAHATGVATLVNDDSVGVKISDVSKAEGGPGTTTKFSFTLTLSAPSTSSVSVTVSTTNGSAVAPGDYTSKTQTVSFAPGQTKKTVVVTVKGDKIHEANETFNVSLTNPIGLKITDRIGVGTIRNDD